MFLKFSDIHQKVSVLTSLFNTVKGLKTRNLKKTPTQVFSCEYHNIFKNSCFIEHLWWLLLNMVEEFLRISNSRYRGVARNFLEGGSKSSTISATIVSRRRNLGLRIGLNCKFRTFFNEISRTLTCPNLIFD